MDSVIDGFGFAIGMALGGAAVFACAYAVAIYGRSMVEAVRNHPFRAAGFVAVPAAVLAAAWVFADRQRNECERIAAAQLRDLRELKTQAQEQLGACLKGPTVQEYERVRQEAWNKQWTERWTKMNRPPPNVDLGSPPPASVQSKDHPCHYHANAAKSFPEVSLRDRCGRQPKWWHDLKRIVGAA